MGFYDEIKGLYKKDIDKKTGLTIEEKQQLDGLVSFIKETVKNNMKLGKCEFVEYFSHDNASIRVAPGALNNVVFTNRDIYCLVGGKPGRIEFLKETLKDAFGSEFSVQVDFVRLVHMRSHLRIVMTWPKPEEVV